MEDLKQIENALNVAVQRGIFADMQSVAAIFSALERLKNELHRNSNNNDQ